MITVNDSHHVDKSAPSYRVRREAMDAAVFAIGPHARNGFEYTTVKCDGRWVWKPTDEVPPMTAAQIKAEGGKRCLVAQQKGTAMAIGPKLVVNALADDLQSREAMLRDLPPACNGLDVAPTDDLAIPTFLQRSTPEAKEQAKKAMKRIAEQVGPDRPIKNPPDAKPAAKPSPTSVVPGTNTREDRAKRRARRKAAGETSPAPVSDSPKRAKRTGEAKTKLASLSGGKTNIGSVARAAILAGRSNDEALAVVMKTFPDCSSNLGCMAWYRNKLKKEGYLKQDGTASAKGKTLLAGPTKAA